MKKLFNLTMGILVGGLFGITAASLLTPKNGEAVRTDIKNGLDEIQNGLDEIKLNYDLGYQKKTDELKSEIKRRWGED